jgi:hypothetical protein
MMCRDFPLLYSAQLDGHATEHEQAALRRHLRECIVCRRRAAEMRSLRADLRALAEPQLLQYRDREEAGFSMTGQIQMALRREAAQAREAEARAVWLSGVRAQLAGVGGQGSWVEFRNGCFNSFANWFDGLRAKIFSQTIGAVVSSLLFFVVVTQVFKQAYQQAYHALTLAEAATQVIFEDPNDEAIRHQALLKAALLPAPPPPALNPSDEFRGAVAGLQEEDVILTAEVRKDGGVTIMYVIPPNDPSVKAKLSTAMSQRGIFQGAGHKRTTNPVAVVYLSSITINGSSSI